MRKKENSLVEEGTSLAREATKLFIKNLDLKTILIKKDEIQGINIQFKFNEK